MTTALSAQLVISSTDYSAYLISSERNATLEQPGATLTLELGSDFPHAAINPWDDLVYYENSVKVLTGYVTHIIPSRSPAKIELQAFDTFKRCLDWFIDDQLYTGGPDAQISTDPITHNVGYYTAYLCNLCGISFSINDAAGSGIDLKSDIPLGLRTVSDALIVMCQVGQWTMRVDADGVLQFDHLEVTTPDYILSQVETFEQDRNDSDTKNLVKIWGFQDFLTSGSTGGEILYQESRAVAGVSGDRAMVYAIPQVDTLSKAVELARVALNQWARLDNIVSLEMVGNPNIYVGQSFQFSHARLLGGTYFNVLTDLKSIINEAGYVQSLSAGRRAYRYPYWPFPGPKKTLAIVALHLTDPAIGRIFYSSLIGDPSPTWEERSNGIPASPVYITADRLGGQMVYLMTKSAIYRYDDITDGTLSWHKIFDTDQALALIGVNAVFGVSFTAMEANPFAAGSISVAIVYTPFSNNCTATFFYSNNYGLNFVPGASLTQLNLFINPVSIFSSISFHDISGNGSACWMTYGGISGTRVYVLEFTGSGATITGALRYVDIDAGSVFAGVFLARQDGGLSRVTTSFIAGSGFLHVGYITGTITGESPMSTATVIRSQGYRNSVAVSLDGATGLITGFDGHVYNLATGSGSLTDKGTGLLSTIKSVICLTSGLGMMIAGSGFEQTLDNGSSFTDQNGNILGLVASPNIISMAYLNVLA